jgi:hypothetical protein
MVCSEVVTCRLGRTIGVGDHANHLFLPNHAEHHHAEHQSGRKFSTDGSEGRQIEVKIEDDRLTLRYTVWSLVASWRILQVPASNIM